MAFKLEAAVDVGNVLGGNLGPVVQRYIPERVSRYVIAAGGFYLAWSLLT